jgi:N-acetylglucosaminyl-diphospho-decaprenol L-rhamnosyltransferase
MGRSKFTSIIVTYNSAGTIANLLSDLHSACPNGLVMVIDNASTDQTIDIVNSQYPQVQLVRNAQNLGYARAVNQGVERCNTDYVFILNPDIRIQSPRVITKMVKRLDGSPITGVTGPLQYKMKNGRKHLNFNCTYLGWRAFRGYLYYQRHHQWPSHKPLRVPLLNAGCIMIRRSAFIQIGGINPKYFLYGEDPDLGLKLHLYGYECWLLPSISVIHYREGSFRTLTAKQRWQIRWQAIGNISHAFLMGWLRILFNKMPLNKTTSH